MEFTEKLKSTLDNTFSLALSLEQVSSMIIPRKIGVRGRKRLININREIKNFSQLMKFKPKTAEKKPQKHKALSKSFKAHSTAEILMEVPSYTVKKKLSSSIKEVNQRVKLSRAGKRSVGSIVLNQQISPLSKDIGTLQTSINKDCSQRIRSTDLPEEKPQPYVSLTNGKIEDPIKLPTFEEFLKAKGDEFFVRKGKDELFYRIDKASQQIDKLKDMLNYKNTTKASKEDKTYRRSSVVFGVKRSAGLRETIVSKVNKKNDMRSLMNQYYVMPNYYQSPKTNKGSSSMVSNSNDLLSTEAEAGLEESIKAFNLSKTVENRKLNDILSKIVVDRPDNYKKKLKFIQNDKEKYKNKLHSIEKFNSFREKIEKTRRETQFKNYEQGLVYLEVLDEYKRRRYEPGNTELMILELWKRMVESGFVINKQDLQEIESLLTPDDLSQKEVQILRDKLLANCLT